MFPLVLAGPPLPSKARLYLQAQPPTPPPRLAFCQSECQGTFLNESPGPNPVPGTWTVTEGGGADTSEMEGGWREIVVQMNEQGERQVTRKWEVGERKGR